MVETITLVGIYRGIESLQGFLGGAKWSSSIQKRLVLGHGSLPFYFSGGHHLGVGMTKRPLVPHEHGFWGVKKG